MAKKAKSQNQRLREFFLKGGKLNKESALKRFGTKNLRARVNDFRQEGMNIVSTRNAKKNNVATYQLG